VCWQSLRVMGHLHATALQTLAMSLGLAPVGLSLIIRMQIGTQLIDKMMKGMWAGKLDLL